MNKLQLKGHWNSVKGQLQKKYGELTDDDLSYVEGSEDQLVGTLQKKLGETRENIESTLADMVRAAEDKLGASDQGDAREDENSP